jgi:cytochrome c oxidase subunit 4
MNAHIEATEHPQHHIVPVRVYLVVFFLLMLGTALTVAAAFQDLDVRVGGLTIPLNTPIAMAIAGGKAILVVLYFMHVKYSQRLVWVWIIGGLIWLGIMIAVTYADYWSRNW